MAKNAAHSRAKRVVDVQEALREINEKIRKKHKDKNLLIGTGDEISETPTEWISTGSLALDRITRGFNPGGIPIGPRFGRIVHLAGDPSTGKSVIADHLFYGVQQRGGVCYCSETEATRDPHFARAIGLDLRKVTMERGAENVEEMLDHGLLWHEEARLRFGPEMPMLWLIDSIDSIEASRSSSHGISESKGWAYGGGKSEALGVGLKRINAKICGRYPTTIVLLNQVRISPQVLSFAANKKYTPGGMALHFYPSLEIILSPAKLGWRRARSRTLRLTEVQRKRFGLNKTVPGTVIGRFIRAKVTKTKVSETPMECADFYIDLLRGLSKFRGLQERLIAEGTCEFGANGVSFIHHTPGKSYEFVSKEEHRVWLRKHTSVLRYPGPNLRSAMEKRAAGVSVDDDDEKDEEGETEGENA